MAQLVEPQGELPLVVIERHAPLECQPLRVDLRDASPDDVLRDPLAHHRRPDQTGDADARSTSAEEHQPLVAERLGQQPEG